MRLRYAMAVLVTSIGLLASGCGGSGSDDEAPTPAPSASETTEAEASETALADATDVCNDVLLLGDGGMASYISTVRSSANTAAGAALDDERWDGLADAASDMSVVYDKVSALQGSGDQAAALARLNELMPELESAKSDFASQCRRVLAAGGDVDESLIAPFIEPDDSGFDDSLFGESESATTSFPANKIKRFLQTVRDLDPSGELETTSDDTLLQYGGTVCDLLDSGTSEGEIALALSEEKDMSIDAAATVMTGAYIDLCS